MNRYILYGASGHAKVILDAMECRNIETIGLVDDNPNISNLGKYTVHQPLDVSKEDSVLVSIGNNTLRKKIVARLAANFFTVIHPSSILAKSVEIMEGSFVAAGVVINPDTCIGSHVIINTSASIDHDCKIGDFVHIAPNATLCGGISVGEGSLIGAGAVILPNINIGKWVTVGAGSVITNDIPDNLTVVGVPAKQIK